MVDCEVSTINSSHIEVDGQDNRNSKTKDKKESSKLSGNDSTVPVDDLGELELLKIKKGIGDGNLSGVEIGNILP